MLSFSKTQEEPIEKAQVKNLTENVDVICSPTEQQSAHGLVQRCPSVPGWIGKNDKILAAWCSFIYIGVSYAIRGIFISFFFFLIIRSFI